MHSVISCIVYAEQKPSRFVRLIAIIAPSPPHTRRWQTRCCSLRRLVQFNCESISPCLVPFHGSHREPKINFDETFLLFNLTAAEKKLFTLPSSGEKTKYGRKRVIDKCSCCVCCRVFFIFFFVEQTQKETSAFVWSRDFSIHCAMNGLKGVYASGVSDFIAIFVIEIASKIKRRSITLSPFCCSGVGAATRPLTAVTHQSMRNQHVQ